MRSRAQNARPMPVWLNAPGLVAMLLLGGSHGSVEAQVEAQACTPGQIAIDGACCWPGQTVRSGVCRGLPDCPDGHAATMASECVLVPEGTRAREPEPDAPSDFVRDRNEVLLALGGALITGGYVLSVVWTYLRGAGQILIGLIPVFGSIGMAVGLEGVFDPGPEATGAATILALAAQSAGVVLLVIGEWGQRPARRVAVLPAAPGSDVGLSLDVTF